MTTPRPEMDSEQDMEIPSLGRTLRLFGRAFTLRCPHCGKGPVLAHWMKLRVRCGHCELRLQRGEHDTVMGFAFILFTMVALAAYVALTVTMLVTRETPWDLLETGLPLLVLALIFVFFPFAKLGWLAFDLMFRPVTRQEMEWHRSAARQYETERDASR
jgi:uncharacterized protein (DUF983 family)